MASPARDPGQVRNAVEASARTSAAITAALLLGRWTLVAERHGGGCSCCPGLGDIAIEEVERRVCVWIGLEEGVGAYLRRCIAERSGDEGTFGKLDEALSELERIQAGF